MPANACAARSGERAPTTTEAPAWLQSPGGLEPESDMTGGDDDVASRQVDACEHVRCRRGRGESRSDGTLVLCHASTMSPLGRTLNGCESIFFAR